MKVAIVGATGPSGLATVVHCLAKGHQVKAVVRNPDNFPAEVKSNEHFSAVKGDIFNSENLAENFTGCDAVISCLGYHGIKPPFTTMTFYIDSCKAIVEGMQKSQVKRFVAMTSWATEYKPDTPKWIEWFFKPIFIGRHLDDMRVMEKYLETQKDIVEYTCVRPAGLTNKPATDKQFTVLPEAQCVPNASSQIARADVARFLVDECVDAEKYKGQCVAIALN